MRKQFKKTVTRLRKRANSLDSQRTRQRLPLLLTMPTFGVIGSIVLFRTFAAGFQASLQSETSARNGAALFTDATASGGQAIQFGSGGVITRYEAEDANHNVTPLAKTNASPAGDGFVLSNFGEVGKFITFSVTVAADGGTALLSRLNDSNTSNVDRSGWINVLGWQ